MKKISNLCTIMKNRGIWNIPNILKQRAGQKMEFHRENSLARQKQAPLRAAFELTGGMGDYIAAANYLAYFKSRYQIRDGCITLYFPNGFGLAKHVFQTGHFLLLEGKQYVNPKAYDVYFTLSRFPRVFYFKEHRVRIACPELLRYIGMCRAFELQHPYFFKCIPFCDGQAGAYCEVAGQTRIQQPDIYGFLGIGERYRYRMNIGQEEKQYLDSLHLISGKFLTIHRGCDTQYAVNMKLWPMRHYEELVRLIRSKYPELTIVQIGASARYFPDITDADASLVGRTDMEEVKVLLKHSLLHIDNEGGMVHLRHALHGGKSIVLFGPTSERFYGYSENDNLRSDICPRPCEWLSADWSVSCQRQDRAMNCETGIQEDSAAVCMDMLLPEIVMEKAGHFLDRQLGKGGGMAW